GGQGKAQVQPQLPGATETKMRIVTNHSFFFFLALAACAAAQESDLRLVLKAPNAVAVAGTPESGYYVLSSDGVVHRYTQTDSDFHYAGTFALHDPASPIDITFARVGHEESVLVTQWFQWTSHASIYHYAPEGKVLKAWNVRPIPTGIVFGPASQQIYFGTYDTNELYKVDIDEGRTHEICSIPNAVGLGPLALDSERQMLYAADKQGAIFA